MPLRPENRDAALTLQPQVARERRSRLRLKWEAHFLLPAFAAVMLAVIWLLTLQNNNADRAVATAAIHTSVNELIDTYESHVARNFAAIEQTLKVTSYAVRQRGQKRALNELRTEALLPPGLIFVISIFDRDGSLVASNPPSDPLSIAQLPYFQLQKQRLTETIIASAPVKNHPDSAPTLHFSRRLDTPGGDFDGMVVVEVEPAYFTSGYEGARQGEHGLIGLFGGDGTIRALRVGEKTDWFEASPVLRDVRAAGKEGWDGVERITAVRNLPTVGMTAVAGLSVEEQLAPYHRHRRERFWQAVMASAAILVCAGLAWLWAWQRARMQRTARRAEARILHMARHDALTDLPNRSLLMERLDAAIKAADGEPGGAVMVGFIDLDGFKIINDGLGHNAGDLLLQEVTRRLQGCLREQDCVGRFGGDEFVLVLPWHQGRHDAAARIFEQIRTEIARPVMLGAQEVGVSCSIGVAIYPEHGAGAEVLLLNADLAMYRAKEAGKNKYQFYDAEMNADALAKLALLEAMREGLASDQFELVYQPKIDLRSGRLFGVEALVRWRHPQHGIISPLHFIPLAEEGGLIIMLGDWVLRTACRQNRAWREAGLSPITVAVNVSARQFDDPALVEKVRNALAESGLEAGALELEVTESMIMRDVDKAVDKMADLTAMGLSLSIDDFGTGYSSLSSLKKYPINTLKIDKSFVRDLSTSQNDQAIIRAIIAMSHELNLRVIAEGVETEQQRAFLTTSGCDEMQGFLFSPAVPPRQIEVFLKRESAVPA